MADQFLGEIRMAGFNFVPTGWAACNGQLLPISQNTALFALLGTYYGGDGKSTFALPNLQGSVPMHQGQGQGLTNRFIGQEGGSEFITLLNSEIPLHTHGVSAVLGNGAQGSPAGASWSVVRNGTAYAANGGAIMAPDALALAGGSLPHNNLQPYLVVNFIIAMQGVFPPRQ